MADVRVDARCVVETPENVPLSFALAGPGTRMAAYTVDLLFRIAILFALQYVLALTTPIVGLSSLPMGVLFLTLFFVEWGYGALFEGLWDGRTPGKRLYQLRVIKEGGYPISFHDAAVRNLLRAADILPIAYGLGLLVMLATRKFQRIGDLVAGTIVVLESRTRLRQHLPSLHAVRPIARSDCQGVYHVSERTLAVIERLFDESRTMPRARTEEIAAVLSRPIAQRLGFSLPETGRGEHTDFLKRVLRSFAVSDDVDERYRGVAPAANRQGSTSAAANSSAVGP